MFYMEHMKLDLICVVSSGKQTSGGSCCMVELGFLCRWSGGAAVPWCPEAQLCWCSSVGCMLCCCWTAPVGLWSARRLLPVAATPKLWGPSFCWLCHAWMLVKWKVCLRSPEICKILPRVPSNKQLKAGSSLGRWGKAKEPDRAPSHPWTCCSFWDPFVKLQLKFCNEFTEVQVLGMWNNYHLTPSEVCSSVIHRKCHLMLLPFFHSADVGGGSSFRSRTDVGIVYCCRVLVWLC